VRARTHPQLGALQHVAEELQQQLRLLLLSQLAQLELQHDAGGARSLLARAQSKGAQG
jgi:hypothetical protein